MGIIETYFDLSTVQKEQFSAIGELYRSWNEKINLISRKDIDNLYEHHILHSLALCKFIRFKDGTRLLDVGTGGGFPGIPLAIFFPRCSFVLLDSTAKKVNVAREVVQQIGLDNVECIWKRAEEEQRKFDFVLSRAAMSLPDLVKILRKNVDNQQRNAIPNGFIVLKGGNVSQEIKPFKNKVEVVSISDYFTEAYFETKKIIYLSL